MRKLGKSVVIAGLIVVSWWVFDRLFIDLLGQAWIPETQHFGTVFSASLAGAWIAQDE